MVLMFDKTSYEFDYGLKIFSRDGDQLCEIENAGWDVVGGSPRIALHGEDYLVRFLTTREKPKTIAAYRIKDLTAGVVDPYIIYQYDDISSKSYSGPWK